MRNLILLLIALQSTIGLAQLTYDPRPQLDDVSTAVPSEDARAVWRITSKRAGHVNLRDASGTELGTVASPLHMDPTGTTPQPVTQSTSPWVTSRNWTLGVSTDSINALFVDVAPATQAITALDTSTASLVGSNGQTFYFGTPTTNSAATFALTGSGTASVSASILGGGGTLVVEVSPDGGAFWFRPNVFQIATQSNANVFTTPFAIQINIAGMTHVRVRSTTSWSGNATITVKESQNVRSIAIGEALPAGGNAIGVVAQGTAASLANAWSTKLTDGTNTMPTMDTATRAGFHKVTDGTNTAAVKAASTAPIATDPALVVVQSPNGNQATAANQSTLITSMQVLDDVPTAANGAFVKGDPFMGQFDDTSSTDATEDNLMPVRITAKRAAHANLRDASGNEIGTLASPVFVSSVDGKRATYSASIANLAMGALATDVFTITGSGTKTIRILRIAISGTETTGAVRDFDLIKRSTANSVGTSTTPAAVPFDSADAAATAIVRAYTANPTLGSTVGTIRTASWEIPATSLANQNELLLWTFGDIATGRSLVLRGTAEVAAINFEGVTAPGNAMNFDITWSEE